MKLLRLKLLAWWTAGSVAKAEEDMATRERELAEAQAIFIVRMENLRRLRARIAMLEAPDVVLRHVVRS